MSTTLFDVAPLDSYAERITSGIAMLGGLLMLPALFLFLSGFLFNGVAISGVVITVAVARRADTPLILSPTRPRDFVEALREALIKRPTVEEVTG